MGKVPRITGKAMVRFLERNDFILRRIVGSHHVLRKSNTIQTVVPVHGDTDLKTGTLRGILRDIQMKPEEFEKLWHGRRNRE